MLTTRTNRLDPSLIPPDGIAKLATAFAQPGHVALIDSLGNRTEIPEEVFQHFARIVRLVAERRAVVLIPEDERFTTQGAANDLGLSETLGPGGRFGEGDLNFTVGDGITDVSAFRTLRLY